jgi:uncharacterized protein (TIGR02118 family)
MLVLGVASAAILQAAPAARGAGSSTVKLIAIYERPDDPEAFFHHYDAVHAPLVKRIPGLQSFVLNRVTEDPLGGAPPFILIAEMTYPDRASYEAAMRSPENQAVARDLMTFAKDKVRVLVTDSAEA